MKFLNDIPSFAVMWGFYVASTSGIFFGLRLLDLPTLAACAAVAWQAPGILIGYKVAGRFDEWRYADHSRE